ncbi:DUF2911 domain-containing protein [Niastella caeni]|uniref:DUF2911 domain-containing protein n=1 Tax=Niastella caeni TaxID=2569763 RepID=A0A4S8I151_9BACT|nr:DUF2911 domain-containing protein [Niastella caeni]THU41700.1 DUF2911 domain-containing protein [Niastella caeni]
MKQLGVLFFGLAVISATVNAQFKAPALDKSPMDMSYYPVNFPILKIQNKATEPLLARVLYSRPQKNGRDVFGELIEYGKIWRLGANEATEIELYKDVKINNTRLKKGRYSIYAIPYHDKWTLIFNRETDIWGAFQYDDKKDVLRTDVKLEKQQEAIEAFTLLFDKTDSGANMIMAWDKVKATLPITFIK